MGHEFRWNGWNVDHIAEHNIVPADAERVVDGPDGGYPKYQGDGKFLVRGQSAHGRYIQAIYIYDPADVVYVIHARPLTDNER